MAAAGALRRGRQRLDRRRRGVRSSAQRHRDAPPRPHLLLRVFLLPRRRSRGRRSGTTSAVEARAGGAHPAVAPRQPVERPQGHDARVRWEPPSAATAAGARDGGRRRDGRRRRRRGERQRPQLRPSRARVRRSHGMPRPPLRAERRGVLPPLDLEGRGEVGRVRARGRRVVRGFQGRRDPGRGDRRRRRGGGGANGPDPGELRDGRRVGSVSEQMHSYPLGLPNVLLKFSFAHASHASRSNHDSQR